MREREGTLTIMIIKHIPLHLPTQYTLSPRRINIPIRAIHNLSSTVHEISPLFIHEWSLRGR